MAIVNSIRLGHGGRSISYVVEEIPYPNSGTSSHGGIYIKSAAEEMPLPNLKKKKDLFMAVITFCLV